MKKRRMFFRMITASLMRRRSRMIVALLSIAIGATILSGLVSIYYDVPRQLGAEFRNYGANMILTGSDGGFTYAEFSKGKSVIPAADIVGAAPYRYENVRIREKPVVAAGTKDFFCFMASHFLRKFPVDLIGEFLARSIGCGAWRPCPPKLSRPGGGSPLRGRARAPWLRAGHTRMHGRAGERVTQGSAWFSGHIWPVLRSPDLVLTWLKYTFSGFCFQWLAAIPF